MNPANTSISSASKMATGAKNAAANGVNKATNLAKKMWSEKTPVMIFIIAVILIFVLVIIYITFALKNSNLSGKVLTKKPIKLDEVSVPFEVTSSDIPKPSVGREYAYSFWLYLESFEQTNDNNKLVFYRGGKDDIATANPVVMLDKIENKMYIVIKTQDSTLTGLQPANRTFTDLSKIIDNNYFENLDSSGANVNKHIIMKVDYVPLQRWVNFVFIVDNKIITLFMDGEIYSVKSTDELKSLRKPDLDSSGNPIKYQLIVDKTDNNIYVGKNSINNRVTANAYLSKLEFHNYAVSLNQIKSIYNAGPLATGMLSSMGIQYGVRSPVYKLNESIK